VYPARWRVRVLFPKAMAHLLPPDNPGNGARGKRSECRRMPEKAADRKMSQSKKGEPKPAPSLPHTVPITTAQAIASGGPIRRSNGMSLPVLGA
jgi:hypothetical protein